MLAEDHHMVQTFAADRTNESFDIRVLPGRAGLPAPGTLIREEAAFLAGGAGDTNLHISILMIDTKSSHFKRKKKSVKVNPDAFHD